ncbi:hypothetical protein CC78DRAFT_83663 [Lojkania enalia]|uniref:DUF6594 domain-containing protein n=1 Tax=Lojkania enalia TaxID=147567 RepID=A0A9P4K0B6_9PLEO|nr:hypothetical protein CC78DRAFT_83663 [Didymosphaeria enalia]
MQSRKISSFYTPFYKDITRHPEIARFRRFGDLWSKKLYDDIEEVRAERKNLEDALAKVRSSNSGVTVLDCPRSVVRREHPHLSQKWDRYEECLLKYGQSLCLSQQIINLPHQAAYASKQLNEFEIFEDDVFGPTGEDAAHYRDPSYQTDACSWRNIPQNDALTNWFINHSNIFEKHVFNRARRFFGQKKHQPGEETNIQHDWIIGFMDFATCIIATFLLTATMFVLVSVPTIKVRIAIVGVFGLVFSLSVKAIAGHPSRGEVFGATAAYFAVASVFVSSTTSTNSWVSGG